MEPRGCRVFGMLLLLAVCVGFVSGAERDIYLTTTSSSTFAREIENVDDEDYLVVTWRPKLPADFIGVFYTAPPNILTEFTDAQPIMRLVPNDYPDTYVRTNVTYVLDTFPNGWNRASQEMIVSGDACLPYWIGAYKDGELFTSNCLRIRPTWMEDHRDVLANVTLDTLFFDHGYRNVTRFQRRYWPAAVERGGYIDLSTKVNVWLQLIKGIRFFTLNYDNQSTYNDFSSFTKEDSRDETEEEENNCPTLFGQLREIKEFLSKAKNEIIIIDVKYCDTTSQRKEEELLELADDLELALGDHLLSPKNLSYTSTLADIWETRRNVIVTLNGTEIPQDITWMWNPLPGIRRTRRSHVQEFLNNCVVTETSVITTVKLMKPLQYKAVVETLGNPGRTIVKLYPIPYDQSDKNTSTTPAYVGNALSDRPLATCYDKTNNLIFLPLEEGDSC